MKSTILMMILLFGIGYSSMNARNAGDDTWRPLICEDDVESILSSRAATVRYQGGLCLYDIASKRIVERDLQWVTSRGGYILSVLPEERKERYRLHTDSLKPVREWIADSSILFSAGVVAIKNEGEWSIMDYTGAIVYRTRRELTDGCFPFLVLDSADALFDTRTDEVLLDSVESIVRWGSGVIVEVSQQSDSSFMPSAFYWFDRSSKKRIELGRDVSYETDNNLMVYDWKKWRTIFDTNMVVLCKLDRSIAECNDSVRVEYSESGDGWCIVDLVRDERRCGYRYIFPDGNGFYIVIQNLQWGLIRYDGKVIIPMCEPVFVDASPKSHLRVAWLPHFSGDDMVAGHITRERTRTYRYDDNGYYRMFPD